MNRVDHLLAVLAEESGEIVQDAMKALRFGLDGTSPITKESNRNRLIQEYNDLLAVVEMLQEEGVFPEDIRNQNHIDEKKDKVEAYLNCSLKLGRLKD